MSTTAPYKALVGAGSSKELAERTVKSVAHTDKVAAKADWGKLHIENTVTKTDLAELKAEILRWNVVIANVIIAAVGLITQL